MQTIGILACAIPEGLPLALVIALALMSNKMTKESNLVKTLCSCETMGSATTFCTDKTGTLTSNQMTTRAAYVDGLLFDEQGAEPVGPRVAKDARLPLARKGLLAHIMCVCTMDESGFRYADDGSLEDGRRAWLQVRRHPGAGCGQVGQHLGPRRVEGVYIFSEADVLGSSECVWRCAAKDEKEGPSQWHYLVGADALYAEYLYLAIFVVISTPVVLVDAEEYAPVTLVTGCFTATFLGWIGTKIATYTK